MNGARDVLADVLDLVQRSGRTAIELRLMLELAERSEASPAELAEVLDTPVADVRKAARDVAVHGLVRSHHSAETEATLLELQPSGRAMVQALLAVVGGSASLTAA